MKAVTALTRFFYGYSSKTPGQTSAKEPMPYPSPTTIIGALAASIGKARGAPEIIVINKKIASFAASLLDKVTWAAPAILSDTAIPFKTMVRQLTVPYQRSRRLEETLRLAFSATTLGWMHYDGEALLTYIVRDEYAGDVAKHAWGMTSLGSKESLLEVVDVVLGDITVEEPLTITTPYPVPVECVEEGAVEGELVPYIPPEASAFMRKGSPTLRYWYVPRGRGYGGRLRVSAAAIRKRCATLKIPVPGGAEHIIVPKEVIK